MHITEHNVFRVIGGSEKRSAGNSCHIVVGIRRQSVTEPFPRGLSCGCLRVLTGCYVLSVQYSTTFTGLHHAVSISDEGSKDASP